MSDIGRLIERIQAEYQAVPGLKITTAQACRLWSVSEEICRAAFDALVADHVLWLAPSGRYVALPRPGDAAGGRIPAVARCPHCQKRHSFQRDEARDGRDVTITMRCEGCQRVFSFSVIAA
jgi:hypothetical protein